MPQTEFEKDLDQLANFPICGNIFKNAAVLLSWILAITHFASFPLYVLMHRNLGERTYSIISISFHLMSLSIGALGISGLLFGVNGFSGLLIGGIFSNVLYWGFIIRLILHKKNMKRREREGRNIYSYSSGEPFDFWRKLPWGNRPTITQGIYEPLALILVCLLLLSIGMVTASTAAYVMGCAISAAITIRVQIARERVQYLDAIDAQILMEYSKGLLQGYISPNETNDGLQHTGLASAPPEVQQRMLERYREMAKAAYEAKQKETPVIQPAEKEELPD